jgi:hypothetical protein
MKATLFFITLILVCKLSSAESTFQRLYRFTDPAIPLNFVPTPDDAFLIYGTSYNNGNNIVSLFKIDSNGDSLWSKAYVYPGFSPHRLINLYDSGFAIIGTQGDYSVLIKYDQYGDSVWTKQFTYQTAFGQSSAALSFLETSDHGFFLVTTHGDSDIVYYDLQFTKLDSNGNLLWSKDTIFGHDLPSLGYVMQTMNNNFLVQIKVQEGGPNIPYSSIMLIDSSGNMNVVNSYYDTGNLGGDYFAESDTNLFIIGNAKDNWDDYGYGTLGKISRQGVQIFDQVFPSTSRMKSVSAANGNGCIVACDSVPFLTSNNEFQLKRYDTNGNILWTKLFPIDHHESAVSVRQTPDGGFLAVGYHESFFHYETYIVKTDSSGLLHSNGYTISSSNLIPCEGDTVTLTTQQADSYFWSNGNTSQSIDILQSGSYNVRIIDSTGAVYFTSFYHVVINPKPILNLGSDTLICFNQVLTLDGGNGFTNYNWQDGSTSRTYNVSGNTQDLQSISVEVTDSLGCINSDTVQVVIDICNDIAETKNGFAFRIEPNPFSSKINFSVMQEIPCMVSIYNSFGCLVLQRIVSGKEEIDLRNEPDGVYFILLNYKDDIFSRKIVKE